MTTMEELLELQNKAVDDLNRYVSNFGKDSKQIKREVSYYVRKLSQLEEWWVAFDSTNTKLQAYATDEEEYFSDNAFDKIRDIYLKHRTTLQDAQQAIESKLAKKATEKAKKQAEKDAAQASTSRKSFSAANLETLKQMQDQINVDESDDDDNQDGFDHQMHDEFSNSTMNDDLPVIKVLKFQYNELKSALNIASELDQNVSSGMASAQLENVKLLWCEFREAYRNVSVSEHQGSCGTINFRLVHGKILEHFRKIK